VGGGVHSRRTVRRRARPAGLARRSPKTATKEPHHDLRPDRRKYGSPDHARGRHSLGILIRTRARRCQRRVDSTCESLARRPWWPRNPGPPHTGVLAEQGVQQATDEAVPVATSAASFAAPAATLVLALRHVTSFRRGEHSPLSSLIGVTLERVTRYRLLRKVITGTTTGHEAPLLRNRGSGISRRISTA
jgi:hypothetical protein